MNLDEILYDADYSVEMDNYVTTRYGLTSKLHDIDEKGYVKFCRITSMPWLTSPFKFPSYFPGYLDLDRVPASRLLTRYSQLRRADFFKADDRPTLSLNGLVQPRVRVRSASYYLSPHEGADISVQYAKIFTPRGCRYELVDVTGSRPNITAVFLLYLPGDAEIIVTMRHLSSVLAKKGVTYTEYDDVAITGVQSGHPHLHIEFRTRSKYYLKMWPYTHKLLDFGPVLSIPPWQILSTLDEDWRTEKNYLTDDPKYGWTVGPMVGSGDGIASNQKEWFKQGIIVTNDGRWIVRKGDLSASFSNSRLPKTDLIDTELVGIINDHYRSGLNTGIRDRFADLF